MASDDKPSEGDTYECQVCDMAILVTTDCNCESDEGAFFSCCGQQMEKQQRAS